LGLNAYTDAWTQLAFVSVGRDDPLPVHVRCGGGEPRGGARQRGHHLGAGGWYRRSDAAVGHAVARGEAVERPGGAAGGPATPGQRRQRAQRRVRRGVVCRNKRAGPIIDYPLNSINEGGRSGGKEAQFEKQVGTMPGLEDAGPSGDREEGEAL